MWSRRSYIIDIYVSSTQQNIAKFFENESVITWYKTGRVSQNSVVLQENKKNATLSFFDNFTQEVRYALWSRGNSNFRWLFPWQSITFKSYPRDFPWVMIILHPSWSENIRISYAFFPLKINSGIVVQTDKLYEKL